MISPVRAAESSGRRWGFLVPPRNPWFATILREIAEVTSEHGPTTAAATCAVHVARIEELIALAAHLDEETFDFLTAWGLSDSDLVDCRNYLVTRREQLFFAIA